MTASGPSKSNMKSYKAKKQSYNSQGTGLVIGVSNTDAYTGLSNPADVTVVEPH